MFYSNDNMLCNCGFINNFFILTFKHYQKWKQKTKKVILGFGG